ncbi:lipase [Metarhizium album ARSEF 1941]|uniref:Lipase n=1 Tax=Metarhizium album (strain ARSEF 1941) TaxID=1081103 RepID=A0A0B2WUZ1_METAS|nr:lipase [Metarhizium album ARSEF 1941]KHN97242.1 lipase [Metarhizium album ARSEF 1941]
MFCRTAFGFAALAAASASIAADGYAKALEIRWGGAPISDTDFDNLKFYSQHSAAAYCNIRVPNGHVITCGNMACPLVARNRPTVVATVVGALTGVGAYVAIDYVRMEIVVSIRGSNNIRNYITDLVFPWSDCPFTSQCKLHIGFAQGWNEIKASVGRAIAVSRRGNPRFTVVFTGHSLGGAVATIGAAYLRSGGLPVNLYTYGAPRVGNERFASWFSNGIQGRQWRVTHEDDPVPRLPPILAGYRHISPEYWLTGGNGGNTYKTDYTVSDVRVCEGAASIGCNAGRDVTDMYAHLYYFGSTASCGSLPLQLRDVDGQDGPLPEDISRRLAAWSRRDQESVKNEGI